MLKLITLGELTIRVDGSTLDTSRIRKPLSVLAVVAAAGKTGVSRDRLQALFWPESDTDRARGGLKQAQYLIRQALGVDPLSAHGSNVTLDPNVIVADLTPFQDHLRAGEWDQAVALYSGPFLSGVYLRDVPEFEQWVDGERAQLAALYARALERLASNAAKQHDLTAAVDWWRRRAELDRLDARVARQYVMALGAAGDREAAIRHATVHAALVRAELGAEPDPEILKVLEQLRATPAAVTQLDASPQTVLQTDETNVAAVSAQLRRALLVGAGAVFGAILIGLYASHQSSGPATEATNVNPSVSTSAAAVSPTPSPPASPAHPEPRSSIGRVLVTPLGNATRDTSAAAFGRLAADWMASGLAQTGLVDVVDAQTTASLLQLRAAQSDTGALSAPDVHRLATDANAKILVVGRYYSTPDSLLVQVMIEDAAHGQLVRALPTVAVRAGDYSKALALLRERIAGAFATLLDPRVESLVDRSMPAPTLAAYQAYSEGLDCFIRGQWGEAPSGCRPVLSFRTAIRADSTWILPYTWLMYEYWISSNSAGLDSLIGILDRRHPQLTDLDRYSVDYFKRQRAGDLEGALMAARHATTLAPRSNWTYQAALAASQLNLYKESVTLLRRHDPEHGWARGWGPYLLLLLQDDHMLGDYRTELRDIETAEKADPASQSYAALRLLALAGLGDSAGILRVVDSIIANPPIPQAGRALLDNVGGTLIAEAREAAVHGHAQLARQLADRCLAIFRPPAAATTQQRIDLHVRSICLYDQGRWADAKAVMERLLAEPSTPVNRGEILQNERDLVNVETRLGDSARAALHMTNALAQSSPVNRVADSLMMLAHVAAIRGMNARAVELLRETPITGGRITMLHRHPDFLALSGYAPFRGLLAPRG